VGRALAERLTWSLFDSDAEIERKAGRSIPKIFAEEGEAAFRELEAEVLAELAMQPEAVITTGGGAVLREVNRRLMQERGAVVRLTATVEEIVRRVEADPNRPLLQGEDLPGRVERLLRERAGLYDFAGLTVETTGREVAEIVEEIVIWWSRSAR
jgi:shikimate kinase